MAVAAVLLAGCGDDDAADVGGDVAGDAGSDDTAADGEGDVGVDPGAAGGGTTRTATLTMGDETWTFSEIGCIVVEEESLADARSEASDDGTVSFEASHESDDGRKAVTVRALDESFQLSMGEGGPDPEVSFDGKTVVFEGTFADDFGSGEERAGRLEITC